METEAQQLTEFRVQELDQAQQRTELCVDELAGAVHRLAEEYRLFRYSSDSKLGSLGAQWEIKPKKLSAGVAAITSSSSTETGTLGV